MVTCAALSPCLGSPAREQIAGLEWSSKRGVIERFVECGKVLDARLIDSFVCDMDHFPWIIDTILERVWS